MEKIKTTGTRVEVFRGKAKHTSGGLKKTDLVHNKNGKIVSKNASAAARKNNNLVKAGYTTEKGKFGAVYVGGEGSAKKSPTKAKKSPSKAKKKSPIKKKGSPKKKSFSFF